MKNLLKYLPVIALILITGNSFGQEVEMADTFRSEGKIYVVVAIVLIVLAGLIAYLFTMDRKISKLERRFNDKTQTK